MNKFIKSILQLIINTSNVTLEVPSLLPWKQYELGDDSQGIYYYWLDKWRHQKRGKNAVSKGVAFSSTRKIIIKFSRNGTDIA